MDISQQRTFLKCKSDPMIFKRNMSSWPAAKWNPVVLDDILGEKQLKFRMGRKNQTDVQWETNCEYVLGTLREFNQWQTGESLDGNPFKNFKTNNYWGYLDYKHMAEIFPAKALQAVDWSVLGFNGRNGEHSTFWLGSAGAYTVGHFDTYGCNLVAQVYGRKQWVLFPPSETKYLYPRRIPYEESSVFSPVHFEKGVMDRYPNLKKAKGVVVTLEQGDILYVPRHWWHFVRNLENSISINTWIEMEYDKESQLTEAVTQLMVFNIMENMSASQEDPFSWLNPTQDFEPDCARQLQHINNSLQRIRNDSSTHDDEMPELESNEQPTEKKSKLDKSHTKEQNVSLDILHLWEKNSTQLCLMSSTEIMERLNLTESVSETTGSSGTLSEEFCAIKQESISEMEEDVCTQNTKCLSITDVMNCILHPDVIDLICDKLKDVS